MTKFLSPLGLADWALSGALAASGHLAVVLAAAHPQHGKAGLVQTFPALRTSCKSELLRNGSAMLLESCVDPFNSAAA